MAMPRTFRKMEVVVVQHVMEESEKRLTPDGVEIRHARQKIAIPRRPYRESLTRRQEKFVENLLHLAAFAEFNRHNLGGSLHHEHRALGKLVTVVPPA